MKCGISILQLFVVPFHVVPIRNIPTKCKKIWLLTSLFNNIHTIFINLYITTVLSRYIYIWNIAMQKTQWCGINIFSLGNLCKSAVWQNFLFTCGLAWQSCTGIQSSAFAPTDIYIYQNAYLYINKSKLFGTYIFNKLPGFKFMLTEMFLALKKRQLGIF